MFGEKDTDGFYRAEVSGRRGLVPCNMISEIETEDGEMMDQLLQQGFLPLNTPVEKIGTLTLIPLYQLFLQDCPLFPASLSPNLIVVLSAEPESFLFLV